MHNAILPRISLTDSRGNPLADCERRRGATRALYDDNEQIRNSGQQYPGSPTPANVPLLGFDRGVGPDVDTQRTAKHEVIYPRPKRRQYEQSSVAYCGC
jgi:hypothetical protein